MTHPAWVARPDVASVVGSPQPLETDGDAVRLLRASLANAAPASGGIRPRPCAFYMGLVEERTSAQPADERDVIAAAELCLSDLGACLSGVVGTEGYRALIQRGLSLAAAEFPTLAVVEARTWPLGRVVGLRRGVRRLPPNEVKEAVALILAEAVWALTRLIGVDTTVQLLRQRWPQISAADLDPYESRARRWR